MKRRWWIGSGAVLLGVAAYFVMRPQPLVVDTAVVSRGPLAATVDEEGRTRVRDRFVVFAPVSGRVGRMTVREGDAVARGTAVARIAPAPLDARGQEAALARLQAAQASSRAAQASVVGARAALDQARRDRERVEQLARQGIATPEQLEQARLAEIARGKNLETVEYSAQAAAHEVEVAQAALTGADPEHDCPDVVVVSSPATGRILRVLEQSERVVAAGTPLLEVGDPRTLEIVAEVLSTDAVRIRTGARVTIAGWGGDRPLAGRVRRVEPSGFTKLSALGVEEQRVNVIVVPDSVPASLGDGFRVEVSIVVWEQPDVARAPVSALFRRGEAWAVFTIAGGRVTERSVAIGQRNAFEAEVTDGLAEGDTVIRHPDDALRPGMRVRPSGS